MMSSCSTDRKQKAISSNHFINSKLEFSTPWHVLGRVGTQDTLTRRLNDHFMHRITPFYSMGSREAHWAPPVTVNWSRIMVRSSGRLPALAYQRVFKQVLQTSFWHEYIESGTKLTFGRQRSTYLRVYVIMLYVHETSDINVSAYVSLSYASSGSA